MSYKRLLYLFGIIFFLTACKDIGDMHDGDMHDDHEIHDSSDDSYHHDAPGSQDRLILTVDQDESSDVDSKN